MVAYSQKGLSIKLFFLGDSLNHKSFSPQNFYATRYLSEVEDQMADKE